MCLYPKLMRNKKYMPNKKNGGKVPPLPKINVNGKLVEDTRVMLVPIGCQNCMECRKQKAREWQVRLTEEIRNNEKAIFITLTYDNKSLKELSKGISKKGYDKDNEIATKSVRRFLERWRKKYKKSVKHWLVTELGQTKTERLHIHGILWTEETTETIEQIWKYGHIWVGEYVNERTVNYIVKYISKSDNLHKTYKPKILTSAGIGNHYMNRTDHRNNIYKGKKTNELYTTKSGVKLALPIYYRNKIYSEEEREKLWQQKLDEEVRYINGTKIDISKGEEVYYKRLMTERKKNVALGYNNDDKNWQLEHYENRRRELMRHKKR